MEQQGTRVVALLVGAAAATEAVRLLALDPATRLADAVLAGTDPAALPLDLVVTAGCALALVACWMWWLLAGLVLVVDVLRHGAAATDARRWCPAVVRMVVLTALGVAAAAGPASADAAGAHGSASAPARTEGVVGLLLPDRVTTTAPVTVRRHHTDGTVRVQRGDSLWTLAARRLPADATHAAVSDAWHRLARVNADRLGDDPDLIFPGTVLRVPDLGTPPGKEPS